MGKAKRNLKTKGTSYKLAPAERQKGLDKENAEKLALEIYQKEFGK